MTPTPMSGIAARARRGLVLAALLMAAGCEDSPLAPELSAAARWEARRPAAYSFVLQRSCFCTPSSLVPVRIDVRNGVVVMRGPAAMPDSSVSGDPLPTQYPTVDDLHRTLVRARQQGASIRVEYDPQWSVPVSAYIDFDQRLADDEQGWRVSDFRVLPDGQ